MGRSGTFISQGGHEYGEGGKFVAIFVFNQWYIVHDSQLGFQEVVKSCGPRGKEDRLL